MGCGPTARSATVGSGPCLALGLGGGLGLNCSALCFANHVSCEWLSRVAVSSTARSSDAKLILCCAGPDCGESPRCLRWSGESEDDLGLGDV